MASPNGAVRQNVMMMANTEGFGQLSPTHQKEMLEALDKKPGDPGLQSDLAQLARSPDFRGLNDQVKSNAIGKVGGLADDPAGRDALTTMATSPGFGQLSDADKNKLLDYTGGHNPLSDPARKELGKLMKTSTFTADPPDKDAQTAALKGFLTNQPGLPDSSAAPNGWFDAPGRRAAYSVSPGSAQADGSTRYTVTIDQKAIPVTVQPPTPPLVSPSIDEIAKGLAATPKANRDQITDVTVSSGLGPITASGGHAYMDTNASTGKVTVYATAAPQGQTFTDSAFIHETGHILSGRTFGMSTHDPGWDRWKAAMKADGLGLSKYGQSSPTEDFSEALLLYKDRKSVV
jgi:hypothetical protein